MSRWVRNSETFGDVSLSVQGSQYHYCKPREYLDDINSYESVEIAVLHQGRFVLPSQIGVDGFDQHFEEGENPVAGYVPLSVVNQIRERLLIRCTGKEVVAI